MSELQRSDNVASSLSDIVTKTRQRYHYVLRQLGTDAKRYVRVVTSTHDNAKLL